MQRICSRVISWRVAALLILLVPVLSVLLAACQGQTPLSGSGTATGSATPNLITPTRAHTPTAAPLRPPDQRPRTPPPTRERHIALDEVVETQYIPSETTWLYTFESERARRVALLLTPLDGDGPLQLQGQLRHADGQIVSPAALPGSDDPYAGEWDLPREGQYTLLIFGPELRPRSLELAIVRRPMPQSGGGALTYGQTQMGEIAVPGQRDEWIFAGAAGDRVLISMLSDGDGVLALYGPAGVLIARADDSPGQGNDPALEATLSASGPHRLVAWMYGDGGTGVYRLSLLRLEDAP